MISIQSLSKHFGSITAVDGVSLEVNRGDVLGFLGPNGAGKSTTMKMVTGFLAPSAGTAVVCGHDVRQEPRAVKKTLGYLPEGAPAYPDMTPRGFLGFVADVRDLHGAARKARLEEVVGQTNIGSVLDQRIETLSKGYKRRVGLAQAILHDPPVLIMDEPTDGLDPNQKHEVRELIRVMAPDKAILLSTHILEEVEAVCSRVAIINRGRLEFDGTPSELESRSRYHNAVRITIRAQAPERVRAELVGLTEVELVEDLEAIDGRASWMAFSSNGRPILASISRLARERAWEVDELHVERGRLDEVFRTLTSSDTIRNGGER